MATTMGRRALGPRNMQLAHRGPRATCTAVSLFAGTGYSTGELFPSGDTEANSAARSVINSSLTCDARRRMITAPPPGPHSAEGANNCSTRVPFPERPPKRPQLINGPDGTGRECRIPVSSRMLCAPTRASALQPTAGHAETRKPDRTPARRADCPGSDNTDSHCPRGEDQWDTRFVPFTAIVFAPRTSNNPNLRDDSFREIAEYRSRSIPAPRPKRILPAAINHRSRPVTPAGIATTPADARHRE